MATTSSLELLRTLLVDRMSIDASDIVLEANLRDDLGMDSLDALELAAGLDEDLGIKVPEDELGDLRTVQDVILRIDRARESGA